MAYLKPQIAANNGRKQKLQPGEQLSPWRFLLIMPRMPLSSLLIMQAISSSVGIKGKLGHQLIAVQRFIDLVKIPKNQDKIPGVSLTLPFLLTMEKIELFLRGFYAINLPNPITVVIYGKLSKSIRKSAVRGQFLPQILPRIKLFFSPISRGEYFVLLMEEIRLKISVKWAEFSVIMPLLWQLPPILLRIKLCLSREKRVFIKVLMVD